MLTLVIAGLLGISQLDTTLGPPKNAIVLFGGADTSAWLERGTRQPCKWKVENGELIVTPGAPDIVTRQEFKDYRLHLEFWLPLMADQSGQGRANSGVYNQGRFEVQILDNYKNPTYQFGGVGAIYGQKDPDVDAIRPPETWNIYDIVFRAARLDSKGKLLRKPRISVWHNGLRIHRDVEIQNPFTTSGMEGGWVDHGPIMLQNHGCAVRYRNIWIQPLG
jgi:hypothetical protein